MNPLLQKIDAQQYAPAASDCSKPLDLLAFLPLKSDF